MKIRNVLIICTLAAVTILTACNDSDKSTNPVSSNHETQEQADARRSWFREAKFGCIIHWGPASLTGKEISWCRDADRPGAGDVPDFEMFKKTVPKDVYDNLYKQFNPVKFNADEWVQNIKEAGMNYLVFVTKHHDGFCMFDTKYQDYKINTSECPWKRDVVSELAFSCKKYDIKFGLYYSPPDWKDSNYLTENHYLYVQKMLNQITELATNYGSLDLFWFDSGFSRETWDGKKLVDVLKKNNSQILINNRLNGYFADFVTPEGSVGQFDNEKLWESSFGFSDSWSWSQSDTSNDPENNIYRISRNAGSGGNTLFGIGPHPDGSFTDATKSKLIKIGQWLKRNGDAIYGTYGGPWLPRSNFVSSCKENKAYIHVLEWTDNENITIPDISLQIQKISLINGQALEYERKNGNITIKVPAALRDQFLTVIEIDFYKKALSVKPF